MIPRNDGTSNKPRCLFPYIRYTECDKDSIERRMTRVLDRFEEIIDGFLLVSFESEEVLSIISQMKNRDKIRHPTELEKEFDLLGPKSIDIESLLPDKHLELSLDLGWTVPIRTKYRYFSFILFKWSRTDRTVFWRKDFFLRSITHLSEYRDYLGDDLPCSHDEDGIPFSNSFFREFVVVMECCPSDDDTAHIHSFEIRHGCHCSRSSD